jgi:Tfp pilus assembly protein PilF
VTPGDPHRRPQINRPDKMDVAAVDSRTSESAKTIAKIESLMASNKLADALELVEVALARDPDNGDLRNAKGCLFGTMNRPLEAIDWYRSALRCNPQAAGIWNNLGTAYKHLKYLGAAVECHRRAIALSEADPLLQHNLALCLAEAGRHAEAVAAFTRTLELDPNLLLARWGRARSYLHIGNYERGWPDFEVRLVTGQLPERRRPGEQWRGQTYVGKRLVVLAEQGFGDTLWAARYLSEVKALGGELFVECQPALFSLIDSMKIADCVIPLGDPIPNADFHSYFCSLPGLFSPKLERVSGRAYLNANPWRRRRFERLISQAGDRLKVGVVWSGSVSFGRNADRALTAQKLLHAVDLPGVQLFSLQKGPPEKELKALDFPHSIIDLAPYLHDFADTAAAVSALDLVIMTDSSVAHLTGALGKPVWVLLGHAPHWLWLLERPDSPWYSSMRLFRPRYEDDWTYVLDRVASELFALSNP